MKPGARILDVGSVGGYSEVLVVHMLTRWCSARTPFQSKGSGYTCAVFRHLAEGSTVVGIDHIPELVKFSVQNLAKDGQQAQLDSGNIVMVAGDGRKGWLNVEYTAAHSYQTSPTLILLIAEP